MRDRMNPYNFGDGAGAVVVRASADGRGIIGSAMACVGGDKKPAMQIIGAGTHEPVHKQLQAKRLVDLKVDVVESGKFTPYVLTEALTEVLQRDRQAAEEIDVCLIPEGNAGYMVEELKEAGLLTPEWTALEGKIVENLALVGATGSAAVPLGARPRAQDRRGQAGRPRDAARDRDVQVEVRGQRPQLDGRLAQQARDRGVRVARVLAEDEVVVEDLAGDDDPAAVVDRDAVGARAADPEARRDAEPEDLRAALGERAVDAAAAVRRNTIAAYSSSVCVVGRGAGEHDPPAPVAGDRLRDPSSGTPSGGTGSPGGRSAGRAARSAAGGRPSRGGLSARRPGRCRRAPRRRRSRSP